SQTSPTTNTMQNQPSTRKRYASDNVDFSSPKRHCASHNRLETPDAYAVAWIAALPIERAAAEAMLDEKHEAPSGFAKHQADTNVYTWGRVGEHNVVIASLTAGEYGTTSAATTASNLLASLPSVRIGLLVGIGGGIARPDHDR